MPLMRIDMIKGRRSTAEIKKIMQIAYDLTRQDFGVPKDDRYQIVTQHEPEEMELLDAGLGIERSADVLFFQILSTPRNMGQKRTFCRDLVTKLQQEMQIRPEDVIVTMATNHAEDWSFGLGKQQFLDGEL
ncbi:putative tautomerase yrdN [Fructilactobacillus florum 8D]|nr:tautomerase family protein [Fructilactobacillus florum]ETO40751.1 putative tautomerase yrdN [Fructilactobacillus florum 8D]